MHEPGEEREGQLSVSSLEASAYTYVEATWRKDLENWAMIHVRALESLGGAPQVLVAEYVPRIFASAASRITDLCRSQLPTIPWPGIIGARNRLVHGHLALISISSGRRRGKIFLDGSQISNHSFHWRPDSALIHYRPPDSQSPVTRSQASKGWIGATPVVPRAFVLLGRLPSEAVAAFKTGRWLASPSWRKGGPAFQTRRPSGTSSALRPESNSSACCRHRRPCTLRKGSFAGWKQPTKEVQPTTVPPEGNGRGRSVCAVVGRPHQLDITVASSRQRKSSASSRYNGQVTTYAPSRAPTSRGDPPSIPQGAGNGRMQDDDVCVPHEVASEDLPNKAAFESLT